LVAQLKFDFIASRSPYLLTIFPFFFVYMADDILIRKRESSWCGCRKYVKKDAPMQRLGDHRARQKVKPTTVVTCYTYVDGRHSFSVRPPTNSIPGRTCEPTWKMANTNHHTHTTQHTHTNNDETKRRNF